MEDDRIRWEGRYAEAALLHGEAPSRFLVDCLDELLTLSPGRRALDIACGEGRNSLFLARNGFQVTGVDIAERALERARNRAAAAGLAVEFIAADLDTWRPTECYDLIVNINFLQRALFPDLIAHLAPGGLLLVDTIMAGETLVGEHNPAYLLAPGELPQLMGSSPGVVMRTSEFPGTPYPHAALLFRTSGP